MKTGTIISTLGDLHAADSSIRLIDWTLNELAMQFGTDFSVWTRYDKHGHLSAAHLGREVSTSVWDYGPLIQKHLLEHPNLKAHRSLGQSIFVAKTTDSMSQRELDQTPLFRDAYRHMGARYQIALFLESPIFGSCSISFARNSRDYSDEQVNAIRDISGHLLVAFARLNRIERLEQALSSARSLYFRTTWTGAVWCYAAVEDATSEKIQDRFGGSREKFTIPQSLAKYFSQSLENTPVTIMDNRGSRWQLTIRPAGHEKAILLEPDPHEAVLSSYPDLTRREKETAHWIGEGKSNAEISIILGISPKTVDKHVENLYRKVGVESRLALAKRMFDRS
jgi:DNA-binding CsgD family transcriptional regulator